MFGHPQRVPVYTHTHTIKHCQSAGPHAGKFILNGSFPCLLHLGLAHKQLSYTAQGCRVLKLPFHRSHWNIPSVLTNLSHHSTETWSLHLSLFGVSYNSLSFVSGGHLSLLSSGLLLSPWLGTSASTQRPIHQCGFSAPQLKWLFLPLTPATHAHGHFLDVFWSETVPLVKSLFRTFLFSLPAMSCWYSLSNCAWTSVSSLPYYSRFNELPSLYGLTLLTIQAKFHDAALKQPPLKPLDLSTPLSFSYAYLANTNYNYTQTYLKCTWCPMQISFTKGN